MDNLKTQEQQEIERKIEQKMIDLNRKLDAERDKQINDALTAEREEIINLCREQAKLNNEAAHKANADAQDWFSGKVVALQYVIGLLQKRGHTKPPTDEHGDASNE